MNQDKIVVVMGGTSTEAEVSRRTGTAILNALKSKGYNVEGMELVPQTFANDIQKTGTDIRQVNFKPEHPANLRDQ